VAAAFGAVGPSGYSGAVQLHSVELHSVQLHSVELHSVVLHSVELHSVELHSVQLHSVTIPHSSHRTMARDSLLTAQCSAVYHAVQCSILCSAVQYAMQRSAVCYTALGRPSSRALLCPVLIPFLLVGKFPVEMDHLKWTI
jgi:hypothetical protein